MLLVLAEVLDAPWAGVGGACLVALGIVAADRRQRPSHRSWMRASAQLGVLLAVVIGLAMIVA